MKPCNKLVTFVYYIQLTISLHVNNCYSNNATWASWVAENSQTQLVVT